MTLNGSRHCRGNRLNAWWGAMHWATPYIGTPYDPNGQGPDSFYCWAFFRFGQKIGYGRDLPIIPNPGSFLAQERLFRDHPELKRWEPVASPVDGDGVQLRKGRDPVHVGMWLDVDGGGVLHCAPGCGVVFQRLPGLSVSQWAIEGYYRFKG